MRSVHRGAGQLPVGVRRRVAHDYFDVFFEAAQEPVESERRPQTVAVRANVGSYPKTVFRFNELNYLTKH